MILYEWECTSGHREEHFGSMAERDRLKVICGQCGERMKRLIGGHGALYFEEGRARLHPTLSDRTISSPSEHARLMRQAGVVEGGNTVPPSVARNPKSEGLRRYMEKDQKGRWF